jgi:hypothetical protein
MPISNRSDCRRWSRSNGATSRTAVYGPVRTVVWQGSAGDRCPYADRFRLTDEVVATSLIAVTEASVLIFKVSVAIAGKGLLGFR